jgi:type 1 glutamine amidotransferase
LAGAKALATSVSERDGKTYPVAWINQYGKARVFGTTYGHSDDTFRDAVFLDYVSRGVLWAAGRLGKVMNCSRAVHASFRCPARALGLPSSSGLANDSGSGPES